MTQMMKAVVFNQYGDPDVLHVADMPVDEPGKGEIRVRNIAAGINPAEAGVRSGRFRLFMRVSTPFILGYDMAGIVDRLGEDVTGFSVGDAVYGLTPHAKAGGYGEYISTEAFRFAHSPRTMNFIEAAAMPVTSLTALQGIRDVGEVQGGQRVLVNGASGGVGHYSVQIARHLGAHVTGVCSTRNFDMVRSLGADEVIDYHDTDVTALPDRYDLIYDTVNAHSAEAWANILVDGGIVMAPNPIMGNPVFRAARALRGGPDARSVLAHPSQDDLATLAGWVDQGAIRSVIDHIYSMEEAAEAHRQIESGHTSGKLVMLIAPDDADKTPDALTSDGQADHAS